MCPGSLNSHQANRQVIYDTITAPSVHCGLLAPSGVVIQPRDMLDGLDGKVLYVYVLYHMFLSHILIIHSQIMAKHHLEMGQYSFVTD